MHSNETSPKGSLWRLTYTEGNRSWVTYVVARLEVGLTAFEAWQLCAKDLDNAPFHAIQAEQMVPFPPPEQYKENYLRIRRNRQWVGQANRALSGIMTSEFFMRYMSQTSLGGWFGRVKNQIAMLDSTYSQSKMGK